jgi:hypothetical protein
MLWGRKTNKLVLPIAFEAAGKSTSSFRNRLVSRRWKMLTFTFVPRRPGEAGSGHL